MRRYGDEALALQSLLERSGSEEDRYKGALLLARGLHHLSIVAVSHGAEPE